MMRFSSIYTFAFSNPALACGKSKLATFSMAIAYSLILNQHWETNQTSLLVYSIILHSAALRWLRISLETVESKRNLRATFSTLFFTTNILAGAEPRKLYSVSPAFPPITKI